MKMTRYFQEQVKRKRPEIKLAWCVKAIQSPIRRVKQEDRRIRHWILIPEVGKYLRVITLEDGETIHNAFFDRDFEEGSE
ncbi:MAG TPA: hypothetical protein VFX30_00440 [bacterium]|nr:hypothetical protein [bacterium]